MDYLTIFGIIGLAALIHSSFQLGVSMMTLLSGHAIGRNTSRHRSFGMALAFLIGSMIITALIVTAVAYTATVDFHRHIPTLAWSIVCGMMIATGLAVWVYYYRRGDGTSLWIPRSFANFLGTRIKQTRSRTEAFSLGMTSVVSETIFTASPMVAAAFALVALPPHLQCLGIIFYTMVASLGLMIVTVLIGSGHSLSRIQRWREANKRFLQFAAGSGLIILGFYLYANEVVAISLMATERL